MGGRDTLTEKSTFEQRRVRVISKPGPKGSSIPGKEQGNLQSKRKGRRLAPPSTEASVGQLEQTG